jgi:hypothetical protein
MCSIYCYDSDCSIVVVVDFVVVVVDFVVVVAVAVAIVVVVVVVIIVVVNFVDVDFVADAVVDILALFLI